MGSWISKGVSLDDWRRDTKLSYTVYWVLACIPLLSLEQLYLGSPKTFFLKHILNVVLLGYPWMYEALMATVARPQVELFGSPNPLTYSIHVGGGRFAAPDEEPSPNQYKPIWYTVGLMFGLFGLDSIIMGHYLTGFFRLFCTLSVVLLPLSLIWWAYKVFLFVFVTDSVYAQDGEWFGYPPAVKGCAPSSLEQFSGWLLTMSDVLTSPFPIVNGTFKTMRTTFETATKVSMSAWGFVQNTAASTVAAATEAASVASSLGPGDLGKKKEQEVTAQAAQEASNVKKIEGGGSSPVLDTSTALGALLTGTVGFIFVSSIVLSWRRTYQNATTKAAAPTTTDQRPGESNDVPPEPRGARATAQGA